MKSFVGVFEGPSRRVWAFFPSRAYEPPQLPSLFGGLEPNRWFGGERWQSSHAPLYKSAGPVQIQVPTTSPPTKGCLSTGLPIFPFKHHPLQGILTFHGPKR